MAYSYNDYVSGTNSDGTSYTVTTSTVFASPPYLSGRGASDVTVAVDGVIKVKDTDYTITNTEVKFLVDKIPPAGAKIRISRNSSQGQRITDYSDASLLNADTMDADANQLFFIAQEALDTASETNLAVATFYSSGTSAPASATAGDLFFNTSTGLLQIYTGSAWESINNRGHKQTFAISGSTTVFTPSNPVDANTLVFLNGVLLVEGSGSNGDYTTSSTQVTLNVAVTSGVVEIISFPNAAFVGTVNAVDGVFSGNLTADTLNTATLSTEYQPLSANFFTPYTRIRETGNGSFKLEGEGVEINVSDGTATNFSNGVAYKRVVCTGGSANGVELKHGTGDTKLSTTATGIDVTGTVTADGLSLGDNEKILLGNAASPDLEIYHNGTDSYIIEKGTGDLNIQSNGADIKLYDDANNTNLAAFVTGGAAKLYWAGNNAEVRLATTETGIDVTGTVTADGVKLGDNDKLQFGNVTTPDLEIYHDGSNSRITDQGTGSLIITGEELSLQAANGYRRVHAQNGASGQTLLYYGTDSTSKLATTSTGIDVTGDVAATTVTVGDSTGTNLELYEDSSQNAIIKQRGTGGLQISGVNGSLANDDYAQLVTWDADNVNLSWQGASGAGTKLSTTETGIDVTGDIEVTDNTKGVILKSPNGSRFRLEVADDGTLSTEAL